MGDFIEDEEEDLYSDLPNFKYDETVDKLQAGNKDLQSRVVFLEDALDKKSKELDGIRSQCETLTKNISSLLKTAQNEIKRKDNKINELNKLVLELKTEVLTLRKRKYDAVKPVQDEEPAFKQQKLDNSPSVKSAISQFFCNPEIVEKPTNVQETNDSEMVAPEKQHAPDIKIHTVYSQRMYNKIYNIGKPESKIKNQSLETKNDNLSLDNKVEENVNSKLEDNNISVTKPKSSKEECGNEKLNNPTLNSQEKETEVDTIENSDNASSVKYSTPLFNLFSNESLSIDSKKASDESKPNEIEKNLSVSISGPKRNEINKEVSSHYSGESPRREKLSANNISDQKFKNNNPPQENKPVIISRMNRSSNFPKKTDSFKSKDVCIKRYSQDCKVSSVVKKDNVSTQENLKILEKTDVVTDKIHSHSSEKLIASSKENVKNSQFSSSFCLKKSKKSIKSVICPISGEWAKNTEALTHSNVVEMDVTKKGSPSSKTGKEDLDIMEHLFGSPLKWTDNSIDDSRPVEKLSPPATAFEDSCSAHIENLKFKETRNNVTEVSKTKITELSLTKKFSYTERKCYFQPTEVDNELPKFDIEKKSDISLSKEVLKQSNITTHWPFKKTNNEIPSKSRQVTSPTFSTFVNTESTSEACDVPPSLKSNPNTLEIVNPFRSPKYNDSVLGQFDDTTQLINALAKDPSKLSPIHTPKKETKLEDASTKTQPESAENCAVKPVAIPVDKKIISSDVEEIKSTHKESTPPVAKKRVVPVTESPLANKKPSMNNLVDKKTSDNKHRISTVEKKSSIPASVISSVEKKLSFPFSVLSPVDKKFEKKTILLEQPVNILCPRKTPRQVSSCRQNIFSKKQNSDKDSNKNNKDESNSIKSPSPVIENRSKTDSTRSTPETAASVNTKNLEDDGSNIKNHNLINNIISKSENNRSSKSPGNSKRGNSKSVSSSNSVSEDRKSIPAKTSYKKDRSPIKEKSKHSSSRKENIPHRRDHKSPSVKENSPLKSRTDHRQVRRDLKKEIFKRPIYRRESFKRPNCFFRQSSVERKIAKDLRHSSKNRSLPVKNGGSLSESSRSSSYKASKSSFSPKSSDSKEREPLSYSSRTPLISRSSRISWSSSTSVIVSTKPSKVQSQNEFPGAPSPSEMKWILRPIDFDQSPSSTLKESSVKSVSETSMNTSVSSSKTEPETPVSKFLQTTDSSSTTPERSSPGKAIVIVAERRPIKFGSNN